MTERTLREKIASLPRFYGNPGVMVDLSEVLALLDAHTAAQPAPDAVARDIADMPEDGTWAVLAPGHYGPFTACAIDGAWAFCDDADLKWATCWLPIDHARLVKDAKFHCKSAHPAPCHEKGTAP